MLKVWDTWVFYEEETLVVLGLVPATSGVPVAFLSPVGCYSAEVFTVVCNVCFRRHGWAQSPLNWWMINTRAE